MNLNPRFPVPVFASLLALGLWAPGSPAAAAELMFSDNFEVSLSSADVNFENTLGRQSGSVGVLNYLENTSGVWDPLSQVSGVDAPGQLRLEATPVFNYTAVSPDHNFVEGGAFTIEFDLDAGLNDPSGSSGDWACVVFGSSVPLAFVDASDGVGILFRNTGYIEVFDGPTDTGGGAFLPLGQIHVRIEVLTEHFFGSPATVRMYVNETQVQLGGATLEYVKAGGFHGNYVTLAGAAWGGDWVHVFDNLSLSATPCIRPSTGRLESYAGQADQEVTVFVPPTLVAASAVEVLVSSADPAIAEPLGGSGALPLYFPQGGPAWQSFRVSAKAHGTTTFSLSGPPGVCVGGQVTVVVGPTFVANPSFEESVTLVWPGYTNQISRWMLLGGGWGLNPIAVDDPQGRSPFADNGVIPDRGQVALIQGEGAVAQIIRNLDPAKQYWLQLHLNARNCCGDYPSVSASFNGVVLSNVPALPPVGGQNPYYFGNLVFSPGVTEGELRIASGVTAGGGDRTLLLDAISIVQRDTNDVFVQNPSFEASGLVAWPGYIQPLPMAGWAGLGNYGVNISGAGPFADNGRNEDQDNVAFIQGQGSSLSQTLQGLATGGRYVLSYAYNARGGNYPTLRVSLDGAVVHEESFPPVGGSAPYYVTNIPFDATGPSMTLSFAQVAAGDHSVLVDNVRVLALPFEAPPLSITFDPGTASVRLAWPMSAGLDWVLESSDTLPEGFGDAGLPVWPEDPDYAAYADTAAAARFYRLRR